MVKYLPQILIALLLICTSSQMGSANTSQIDGNAEAALERYRQIEARGGWRTLSAGPVLRLGVRSERVFVLRHRLRATGDLPPSGQLAQVGSETTDFDAEMVFDHDVERAVRQIQRRHGLEIDGIVGGKTLAALNIPVEHRIEQLRHYTQNWRLPEDLGDRYIVVNIPDFSLRLIEQGQEVWTTRVVVGKPNRRTPMLRSTMDHLVLNPYWNVPSRIATQEILPRVAQKPQYLSEQQMEVVTPRGQVIDPSEIDWAGIDWTVANAPHFPYRIRQRPGAKNALGRVKFIFPNEHRVYLHDTPSRALFARAERAYSHGCVRVEHPLELAAHLLRQSEHESWTPERVEKVIRRGKRQYVKLSQPIDVHVVYRTAWVDDDGIVQFRPDIYQYDRTLKDKSPILLASQ